MYSFDIGNICGTQIYSQNLEDSAACTLSGGETLGSSLVGSSNYSDEPSCRGDVL